MSLDSLRALAIDCHPWHEACLTLSFLTNREAFGEDKYGKWSLADWRMYSFTSGPSTHWPLAADLMREAHDIYQQAHDKGDAAKVRDMLVSCCAKAIKAPSISQVLKANYRLAPDFELFAGHPDDPGQNHCGSG